MQAFTIANQAESSAAGAHGLINQMDGPDLQEQLDKLQSDLQAANKQLVLLNSEVQVC